MTDKEKPHDLVYRVSSGGGGGGREMPTATENKFCVNCRHHYHNSGATRSIPAGHRCTHDALTKWNLVTGERIFFLCESLRLHGMGCGIGAKHFEPKVPVFRPFLKKEKKDD
jgi:hypothetical protein